MSLFCTYYITKYKNSRISNGWPILSQCRSSGFIHHDYNLRATYSLTRQKYIIPHKLILYFAVAFYEDNSGGIRWYIHRADTRTHTCWRAEGSHTHDGSAQASATRDSPSKEKVSSIYVSHWRHGLAGWRLDGWVNHPAMGNNKWLQNGTSLADMIKKKQEPMPVVLPCVLLRKRVFKRLSIYKRRVSSERAILPAIFFL